VIQLTDYQISAINRMKNGCVLRGGTGSGKTLTSLVYIFEHVLGGETPIYPGHKYSKPHDTTPVYVITTPKKRDSGDWSAEAALVPMDLHVVDSWNNIKKYEHVKDCIFIFDETKITGYGSWAYSFIKIAKNNKWILLSATPGDSFMEYTSLFVANGFYKNKTEFEREHIVWSRFTKYPKVDRYLNISKLIRLRDSILIEMPTVRATTQNHKNIICDYNQIDYDILFKKRWNFYDNKPIRDVSELCYLLRKVVNSDPSRLDALDLIYKKHPRLIIFYNYNYELDILRKWCKDRKLLFSEWNGHNHDELPEGKSWAYLCQYTAAQEAWNCIETDCTIFYSQTYSYKALTQSAGRIDRMNTPYQFLYYYHLVSKSSIDAGIQKALTRKENFNEGKWINF
jgi:hypothetical protein